MVETIILEKKSNNKNPIKEAKIEIFFSSCVVICLMGKACVFVAFPYDWIGLNA